VQEKGKLSKPWKYRYEGEVKKGKNRGGGGLVQRVGERKRRKGRKWARKKTRKKEVKRDARELKKPRGPADIKIESGKKKNPPRRI